jgi:hypothetical protein
MFSGKIRCNDEFNIGATLGTTTVSSTPSEVSSSATLDFLITPPTAIPINGKIVITLPTGTSITQGTLTCSVVSQQSKF